MKKIFASLCLSFLMAVSFAQTESFSELSNKLLCYAYDYKKADTATYRFLKDNFPYRVKPTPEGGWVMAPISVKATFSTTSLNFNKHPFFDFSIKAGRLDFETVNEPGSQKWEKGAKLVLVFENEQAALSAYMSLITRFMSNSVTKDTGTVQNKKIGKFSGPEENNWPQRAQIVLSNNAAEQGYIIEFAQYFWKVK